MSTRSIQVLNENKFLVTSAYWFKTKKNVKKQADDLFHTTSALKLPKTPGIPHHAQYGYGAA